jgi:hypothetical protein
MALAEMGYRGRELAVKRFDRKTSTSLFAEALAELAPTVEFSEPALPASEGKEKIPLGSSTFPA